MSNLTPACQIRPFDPTLLYNLVLNTFLACLVVAEEDLINLHQGADEGLEKGLNVNSMPTLMQDPKRRERRRGLVFFLMHYFMHLI